MDREEYYEDLRRRKQAHWDRIRGRDNWQPCMHEQCANCHGTGLDQFGRPCIHGIACPCPKCSPQAMRL